MKCCEPKKYDSEKKDNIMFSIYSIIGVAVTIVLLVIIQNAYPCSNTKAYYGQKYLQNTEKIAKDENSEQRSKQIKRDEKKQNDLENKESFNKKVSEVL